MADGFVSFSVIATGEGTDVSSLGSTPFLDNMIYEHRVECSMLPGFVDWYTNIGNVLAQNGAEIIDNRIDGNTIIYQFRKMLGPQGLIAPLVLAELVAIVLGAIVAFVLIIRWSLSVAAGAGWDVIKIAAVGFIVVLFIAGAYFVLKKSGADKLVGKAVGVTGSAAGYVRRRITEEF